MKNGTSTSEVELTNVVELFNVPAVSGKRPIMTGEQSASFF